MKTVRIRGLVRLADRVRRELGQPVDAQKLARLRIEVADGLDTIRGIMATEGVGLPGLAGPSRKAFQYLSDLDFDAVSVTESVPEERFRPGSVGFTGLRAYFDGLLDRLALSNGQSEQHFGSICHTAKQLEEHMRDRGMQMRHVRTEARGLIGWLAFFSQRERFDLYISALALARPALEQGLAASKRYPAPAIVHFRPINSLWRMRADGRGTLVHVATPLITLDREGFALLAASMGRHRAAREAIVERSRGAAYRAVDAELERLSGAETGGGSAFHDLAASFARVNAAYFGGQMPAPRLVWSSRITGGKFGHYDHAKDVVMVSSTLDSANVPAFVVDYIVFHELLHKKHGWQWREGRQVHHFAEFRAEERSFVGYAAADAALKELAKRYR